MGSHEFIEAAAGIGAIITVIGSVWRTQAYTAKQYLV